VDTSLSAEKQRKSYVQQRAKGAYIASICQPEAAFDLSVAAQHQNPDTIALIRTGWIRDHARDIDHLNDRLHVLDRLEQRMSRVVGIRQVN
jgi:hypothetical protein